MTWLVLVVTALAVFRLTRLVTSDTITEPLRARVLNGPTTYSRAQRKPSAARVRLYDFITCAWCVSMWIAALAVVELQYRWAWWAIFPFYVVLALSAVAGYLSAHS